MNALVIRIINNTYEIQKDYQCLNLYYCGVSSLCFTIRKIGIMATNSRRFL